jgi:excisionase family DNA binding protein
MTGARTSRNARGAPGVDGVGVALDEPLLDCVAAAALLNVRVSWVRDAARLGHLPCLRVGRHLRFTRVMLEDWLAAQCAVASTARPVYVRAAAGAGRRSGPRTLRRGTQAALLASLAETPKTREVDEDG